MSKASDFEYKWHDDNRPLGPPHQRFPDMHPEQDMSVKNEVFLEIPKASVMGVLLPGLAGGLIYVSILCFLMDILTWKLLMVKTPVIWAMTGVGGGCILLSLLARPPLPYRLNRITQELIISNGEQVLRIPWKKVPARISKRLTPRGACFNYTLQFGFGPSPDKVQMWTHVAGYERYEEEALRCWEYFCRYMESPDGHVALRKTPDHEKSADRKMWEEDYESVFRKITFIVFVSPMAWITAKSIALNKRKHKPWPQEVLDICDNHPLLQGKRPEI